MRTTLVLEDALFAAAKREAERSGRTLSEVVNGALRETLYRRPRADTEPFRMPIFGDRRKTRHRSPAELAAALEGDDLEGLRR